MIQWYPGHMAKTKRTIISNLKLVDIVYEIIDARIPYSSRNPIIDEILGTKKRLLLLNKSDLSDNKINDSWILHFRNKGIQSVKIDASSGIGLKETINKTYEICYDIIDKKKNKGMIPRLRTMILGIPNVGKSTLINKLVGNKRAKTGNKPGVTKSGQWIKTPYFDLMDTPGILWPKFEDEHVGIMLALTGAIKDEILNIEEISIKLIEILKANYQEYLKKRYKIDEILDDDFELLKEIGRKRGCLISGGDVDILKTSGILIDDFRSGRIGKISLERPD